jgi:hypothetical protein
MKAFFATVAVGMALSVPAFAQGNAGNNEYAGQPLNSGVRSAARNPETGLSPGAEASRGHVVKRKHVRSGRYVYSSRRGRYVFVPN